MLVFVNAMIPKPGETAGEWWSATGATEAREKAAARRGYAKEFDMTTYFLHDVPHSVLRTGPEEVREEAHTHSASPAALSTGPTSPFMFWREEMTAFSRSNFNDVSRVKVWKRVDQVPGGHLVALSNAEGLTARFLAYAKA